MTHRDQTASDLLSLCRMMARAASRLSGMPGSWTLLEARALSCLRRAGAGGLAPDDYPLLLASRSAALLAALPDAEGAPIGIPAADFTGALDWIEDDHLLLAMDKGFALGGADAWPLLRDATGARHWPKTLLRISERAVLARLLLDPQTCPALRREAPGFLADLLRHQARTHPRAYERETASRVVLQQPYGWVSAWLAGIRPDIAARRDVSALHAAFMRAEASNHVRLALLRVLGSLENLIADPGRIDRLRLDLIAAAPPPEEEVQC